MEQKVENHYMTREFLESQLVENKNRIEQLDEARASRPIEIIDISRQPQTAEQRAASAIDMRERVNLDNQ